ncbi:MAG: cyclic nucleotide-binding domain-containing protein [Actinomycetota bacterium]
MDQAQTVEQLRAVPLFRDFSDEELGHVAQVTKRVEFPDGRTVANQGQMGVGFHLIIEGGADVIQDGSTIGHLKPGDYFGEISLIDGGTRSATVTTTAPTTTLSIAAWDFSRLIEHSNGMMKKLLIGLCHMLRTTRAQQQA